jgi:PEP-CTERM motif
MQMHLKASVRTAVAVATLVFFLASAANAATIIKLSLGNTGPDVEFNGGVFSTSDDLVPGTVGNQNTAAEFLDFLNFQPDVPTPTASYTLSGVTAVGPPANVFGNVVQSFAGGNFFLYDPSNALLLSGQLGTSVLFGTVGPPSTGAVFSTSVASVTGGSLGPFISPNSLSLSISMTNVNSGPAGTGFQLGPGPGGSILLPFRADVTQTIAGDAPEPSSVLLAMLGGVLFSAYSLRRKNA